MGAMRREEEVSLGGRGVDDGRDVCDGGGERDVSVGWRRWRYR